MLATRERPHLQTADTNKPKPLPFLSIGLFFFLSLTVCTTPTISLAEKKSHFIEAWRTSRPLPIGTNLAKVANLLEKKIILRQDLQGIPISSMENSSQLYLARAMPAGAFLVEGAVVEGIPDTLRDRVPPTRKLLTFLETPTHLQSLTLCRPYERASMSIIRGQEVLYEIEKNVGVVSFQIPRSGDSATKTKKDAKRTLDTKGIVVLALREEDAAAIEKIYDADSAHVNVQCLNEAQYE